MDPLGLDWVEPGAFDRQETNQDAHAFCAALDFAIMFSDPATHGLTGVPTSIVPDQSQDGLPEQLDLLASPIQELDGDLTHGTAIHKAQEHFLDRQCLHLHPAQQDTVTGQGFWVRVIFLLDLFDQTQRALFFTPTRQVRLRKTAPPSLILEAPRPSALRCQPDYPVAGLFLRWYCGSGLVIQCLARFQETFKRFNASRTLSPLIRRGVMPSEKLTCAADSLTEL